MRSSLSSLIHFYRDGPLFKHSGLPVSLQVIPDWPWGVHLAAPRLAFTQCSSSVDSGPRPWDRPQPPPPVPRPREKLGCWDSPASFQCPLLSLLSETRHRCCSAARSCPTLADPVDWSPPCCPFYGILQARILEWGAISFSRDSTYYKTIVSLLLIMLCKVLNTPWKKEQNYWKLF